MPGRGADPGAGGRCRSPARGSRHLPHAGHPGIHRPAARAPLSTVSGATLTREWLAATLGPVPEFSKELLALLARQDGVATRAQLVAHGVSPAAVRWNSGRSWRVLLPHVVVLSRETPRPRQRLVAGLLWAGDRSVLAGPTAAAQHGITSADPRERVHLVVPPPLEQPAQRLRRGATNPAPRRRRRHPRADPAVVAGTGRRRRRPGGPERGHQGSDPHRGSATGTGVRRRPRGVGAPPAHPGCRRPACAPGARGIRRLVRTRVRGAGARRRVHRAVARVGEPVARTARWERPDRP